MAKKYFICKVCGDIHYGSAGPVICPTCQSKDAYVPIAMESAKKTMGF
jgi:rubrerythrin